MQKPFSSRLFTAKALSLGAMAVLLGFISWWLVKTFTEEKKRHRRELELVFRETYMQTQFSRFWSDSSFRRRIRGSGALSRGSTSAFFTGNRINADGSSKSKSDTNITVTLAPQTSAIRMRFGDDDDFIDSMMGDGIQVSVPVPPWDTLHLDTVRQALKLALLHAGLPSDFELKRIKLPRRNSDSLQQGAPHNAEADAEGKGVVVVRTGDAGLSTASGMQVSISTSRGQDSNLAERQSSFIRSINSGERLVASFNVPYMLLLGNMKWQMLFSVLMIALIGVALYYNHRNMLVQARLVKNKNDLISNITHELKTPIATVGVALEAMQNYNALQNTERTKEYLSISQLELQRLNMLVDKVLNLSMFDAQQMQVQMGKVNVPEVAKKVASSLQLQLEKTSGEITWHTDGGLHIAIADKEHLTSIFFNLLDNAIKYQSEQRPLQIAISFAKKNEQIVCRIEDNGIGIASEERKRVFEKFYRVQNGDTHDVKGYGLGLSYVAEAMAAMNGSIHIETGSNAGTAFVLSLLSAQEA